MNPIYLRTHTTPDEWVVTEQYTWRNVVVPVGFITDLASIPWIVEFLFLSDDTRKAAVVHDWLYCENTLSRKECDDLFYEALIESGVNKQHALAMWIGVRVGGWLYYNKRSGITDSDMLPIEELEKKDG